MRTLLVSAPLRRGCVEVLDEEAHHGRSVLRLRAGDELRLCDGEGRSGIARVELVERHRIRCQLDVVEEQPPLLAEQLRVVVAPPKGGRLEDLVRALTELGVGCIQPLACERASRQVREERLQRVAAEAIKQCGRSRMPRLPGVVDLATLSSDDGNRIVLDTCSDGGAVPGAAPTTLIIGPEGGFSDAERAGLRASGACFLKLCPTVLRIETAAVAAAAVVIHAWESDERRH
jgi:16S rRNA (uracil1498-N3)-methyltransferase